MNQKKKTIKQIINDGGISFEHIRSQKTIGDIIKLDKEWKKKWGLKK